VGHAAEVWSRLSEMMEKDDLSDLASLYTADAVYLEPYNPPHRGDLLIQAYLKDYLGGKDDVDIQELRVIESADGTAVAIEWTISYTAGGRRWNDLPRASFLVLDESGRVTHHRDYS
jgi:ketosteroid isomerase-like protein